METIEKQENLVKKTNNCSVKPPLNKLAIASTILGVFSFVCAIVSFLGLIFTAGVSLLIGVIASLSSIGPLLHMSLSILPLITAILAVVFAFKAKKKGNKTKYARLGYVFGLISVIVLGLLILLLATAFVIVFLLDVIWFIISFIVSFVISFALSLLGSVLGAVVSAISTVLLPILSLFVPIFGDVIVAVIRDLLYYLIELLKEWIEAGASEAGAAITALISILK